jgi:FkbM family methyltransferase
MHKGEDTGFYLQKGFSVIAIEAHTDFCMECKQKFQNDIDSGKLVIINKAISDNAGPVSFYINEKNSVWGTINPEWAKRNKARGFRSHQVTIESITIKDVIQQYGVPHYMKIDIEGADTLCLKGLEDLTEKPKYISVESSATSIKDTFEQLKLLKKLGYTKYKIVPQHNIEEQRCPNPAREGEYVDHQIEPGSSGLFGEETPGEWWSLGRIRLMYIWIHFECGMMGPNNGVFRNIKNRKVKKLLKYVFKNWNGWYDTHATY